MYDAANVTISNNQVGDTQGAIVAVGDGSNPADNATITGNVVYGTLVWDGIDVCGSTGGRVTNNTVTGSGQSGIHLDGECSPNSGESPRRPTP